MLRVGTFLFLPRTHRAPVKLALHRSITFWSGILMMGFICWAWRDSTNVWTILKGGAFECQSTEAAVTLRYDHYYRTKFKLERTDLRNWIWVGKGSRYLMRPFFAKGGGKPQEERPIVPFVERSRYEEMQESWAFGHPRDWYLILPYWIALLAVAVPWLGLLFWRARRRMRASAIA